jgi:hypothetical protein
MNRVVALAACGLALAGCSTTPSWMPSMELPRSAGPVTTVQLESEPAGAEAKTSTGQACRTPCSLSVTGNEFTVNYTLQGYQPQTVPVRIVVPPNDPTDPGALQAIRVVPNPVYAELQPAAPPPPTRRRAAPPPKKPRPVAAAPARPAPAAAMAPAPAPAPASPWPPPPAAR